MGTGAAVTVVTYKQCTLRQTGRKQAIAILFLSLNPFNASNYVITLLPPGVRETHRTYLCCVSPHCSFGHWFQLRKRLFCGWTHHVLV